MNVIQKRYNSMKPIPDESKIHYSGADIEKLKNKTGNNGNMH
jgi:hypothetical protein